MPKAVPLIVSALPAAPVLGLRLVMLGFTVKLLAADAWLPTVITTFCAPAARVGTVTVTAVLPQAVTVALLPPTVTVLAPGLEP